MKLLGVINVHLANTILTNERLKTLFLFNLLLKDLVLKLSS